MQATNLKNIYNENANYDELAASLDMNAQSNYADGFNQKQLATDKLKALGEEIASWFLVVSVVTVLIQFFSNLQ